MEIQSLFEVSPAITLVVPLIIGVTGIVKNAGLPSKYAPVVSLLLGFGGMALTGVAWQAVLVQGVIAGLTASGLYSGTKAVTREF